MADHQNNLQNHSDKTSPLIEARGVRKTYSFGAVPVEVLSGADLIVHPGEWVAVLGSSGSGKSTLLHLLGGLDRPDKNGGEICFDGQPISVSHGKRLDGYRNKDIGFVFQFYHLLPELSVFENAMLPGMVGNWLTNRSEARKSAGSGQGDGNCAFRNYGAGPCAVQYTREAAGCHASLGAGHDWQCED